jgi:hypothetical protein
MYIFLIHIRLICEVPQTGDEIKSQDENSTQEKTEGTKLVKLILTPSFGIALPAPSLLLTFFGSLTQVL